MAMVCTKCGADIPPATTHCPSCGAHVGTPEASPHPASSTAAPVPPPAYGQPAPPKSSGGVLKVVLIVVAAVVVLGVLGVGAAVYMGYRALHAPGNSVSVGPSAQVSDTDLGVSIYPGAVAKQGMGARLKLGNNVMVSATYTTSDPVSSVEDFYRNQVGGQAIESKTVRGTSFESVTTNGAQKNSLVVTISPSSTSGLTQIVILHTKSVAP